MHYHAEIVIPPVTETNFPSLKALITLLMAPHEERYTYEGREPRTDDEADNAERFGFWDWWQIGGRYTGAKSDYDPRTDPRNIETCTLCDGSGVRRDEFTNFQPQECNGCTGEYNRLTEIGKTIKWPTEWVNHPGDLCRIADAPDDLTTYTLLVGEEVFHADGEWHADGSGLKGFNVKEKLAEMGVAEGYLITVDYHC